VIDFEEEDGGIPLKEESSSDFSVDEGLQLFSQTEWNDLVKRFRFVKYGAEYVGFNT